jgi:DNA-binding NarL/FixJ family response regulator
MQDQSTIRSRVLIADDHSVVAEGLRSLLEKKYEVVGIVPDGRELLVQAPELKPDVIVLDIGMPLLNGLDAAERLLSSLPQIKFVFLTMNDDPNLAAAALKLGAVGYVLKHTAASELLKAVSEVLQGRSYVTAKLRAENGSARGSCARFLKRADASAAGSGSVAGRRSSHERSRGYSQSQREDSHVSQVPHHAVVQPEKQRGLGLVRPQAPPDFLQIEELSGLSFFLVALDQ